MYRKLRIKIALVSIFVLLVLFLGTIGIVYGISYRETMRADREMLTLYTEAYWKNGNPAETEELPPAGPPPGETSRNAMPQGNGRFGSVELDETGGAISVNNPDPFDIADGNLIILAQGLTASGRSFGVEDTWVYYLENHDGRTLVSFLDNTLVSDGTSTLFANTLRFGGLMIVILCVIVWFTSGLLVRPLERNEQEQRRFVSDAGHELKTPVSVIATNAELLRREIGSNRWLENIMAENERSGKLIKSLLALTRAQEESAPMEAVSLSDIAESTILPFEGVAFEKGHVLNSSVQPGLHMRGNEQQLSGLISILLDNAIQYSIESSEIDVSLSEESHHLLLRVSNQSDKLSEEQCRQLFDRFYRSDSSRAGDGHYGLGLSIAQKIVQSHHGEISASWKDGVITIQAAFFPAKV